MNMVIPDEGKKEILDELFRLTSARPTFTLDLFKSNTTVGDASTAADFTIATFTGYAQVAIARADFGAAVAVANVGEITKTVAPVFTCTAGAAQLVYGWILRNAATGKIWAGQNFDSPRSMAAGATETIDPFKIKDKTFA
jgi:hypothetical protein